ncbi:MAG: ATP-binding protein [Patescibacteria group bacterium]|nr:ATP-binding protein [Patescibacteria group bacterium]
MKLNRVRIKNYKSVAEADFPIDKNLTSVVGANEHGKTNLLKAIQLLDFSTPIQESDKRVSKNPIIEKVDKTSVAYEFVLFVEEAAAINGKINEKVGIPVESKEGQAEVIQGIPTSPEVAQDAPPSKAGTESAEEKEERKPINIGTNIELEISYNDGKENYYSIINPEGLDDAQEQAVIDFLQGKLEKNIFFFDTFEDRLNHRIPKEEIIGKKNDVTNGLIKLAGLSTKEASMFEDTSTARQLRLNGAEELTKQLKKLWIQGKEDDIKIKLSLSNDGNFLNVDIEDFNTYGDVSTRSRGFLFFLSFILKFKEYHDGDLNDFIFLIDEPGIFLHPRGQKDLLLYLESLSEFNQLIYTTHSPFMINRLNNFRVRVVSKDKDKGTQVDVKPYIHNWKSLRASLGMMLADSFYYADNNLIVEGPSDRLYLLTLLKIFNENEFVKADLNILSIIDSGGAPNISSMCRIVKSEERPYVAFVDSDKSGKRAKTAIVKFTEPEKVKEVSDFNKDAITIEDLLPRKYFNSAVNAYIQELADDEICSKPTKDFDSKTKGAMEQLEKYIKENSLGIEEISKLNIARHFENQLSDVKKIEVKDFSASKDLIDWIVESLRIGIGTE